MFDLATLDSLQGPTLRGPNVLDAIGVSDSGLKQAAANSVSRSYDGFETVGMATILGGMDLVDAAASSISTATGGFMGVERGAINERMLKMIDSPYITKFYEDNKGAVEMASGIMGVIAAELVTRKITAPASAFMQAISKIPGGRFVAAMDNTYWKAMERVRAAGIEAARRGMLGEAEMTYVMTSAERLSRMTGAKALTRADLRKQALLAGSAIGTRNALITEAQLAIAMNQNGFLFQDDVGTNMAWMAAGVGLSAGVDALRASRMIRTWANDDLVRRQRAEALDPDGHEDMRLLSQPVLERFADTDVQNLGFLADGITDKITSLALSSKSLGVSVDSMDTGGQMLAQNRRSLATQTDQLMLEETHKVTTKGITTDGSTRFSKDTDEGAWQHVKRILKEDPAGLFGVRQIGKINPDVTPIQLHQSHVNRLEEYSRQLTEALKDPKLKREDAEILQKTLRRTIEEQNSIPVAWIDGERVGLEEAEAAIGFIEPKIVRQSDRSEVANVTTHHWEAFDPNDTARSYKVSIDSNLQMTLPEGRTLDNADYNDMRRLYRVGNQVIDHFVKNGTKVAVPENANWFQLDLVEEIARRTDGTQIMWPAGMTRERAIIESLAQKAKLWEKLTKGKNPISPHKLRVQLNLPRNTSYEAGLMGTKATAIETVLRGLAKMTPEEIKRLTLAEIKNTAAAVQRVGDMAPVTARDVRSLSGNSFKFMWDEDTGKALTPLLGYVRKMGPDFYTKANLADRIAMRKTYAIGTLMDDKADAGTRTLAQAIMDSPDLQNVSRSHELAEAQIEGIVGGANQNILGATLRAGMTREWIARDNPIILGAQRLHDQVSRLSRGMMRQVFEETFEGRHNLLANPRNAKSKLLLNQFHTFRPGWDLTEKTVQRQLPDGSTVYAFVLRHDSAINQRRWREMFGEEIMPGATLRSHNGTEIVLDDLGMDLQLRYNRAADRVRQMQNTVLRANGLREIESTLHYVPSVNTEGKHVGFVFGPDGKVVEGMTVVAPTRQEFERMKAKTLKELEKKGLGYHFQSKEEVERFGSIWDRASIEWMSAGQAPVLSGKSARGALTGIEVIPDAFESSMRDLERKMLRHGNDVIETVFKDNINAAKARSRMVSGAESDALNAGKERRYANVFDIYQQALLGKNPLQDSGSAVAQIYNTFEDTADAILAQGHKAWLGGKANLAERWGQALQFINNATPWNVSPKSIKAFNVLAEELGPYMPFKTISDMLESQGKATLPWSAKGVSARINAFDAAMRLRIAEVAHPLMNLAGVINAMPAVVRFAQPRVGESAEEYARRVGHVATIFNTPQGRQIGLVDTAKIAARAFKAAWNRTSHADFDYMVSRGYLSQEVAELHKQFGAIKSRAEWEKFFVGDPTSENRFKQKGVVGWLSVLSDKSEDFSRSWGHFAGLELGRAMGITNRDHLHAFAHDLANKMIANYNPSNRPEIFQGAFGASIGLYQSFVQNYYQRIFRYIETGDNFALAQQYGWQAGLFGVGTVPGWAEANDLIGSTNLDAVDIEDQVYNRLGYEAGSVFLNGALSSLPMLFGGDGVDLYSRGDTEVRLPTVNMPAAISHLKKIYEGIGQGLDMAFGYSPEVTGTQVAEWLSNMIVNRPIAGMIEQAFAHGNDVDPSGQIASTTNSLLEGTYRVMGVRSMRQSQELDAFYKDKRAQENQNAIREHIRLSLRAAVREDNWDAVDSILTRYFELGGDPRQFKRLVRDAIEVASGSRAERRLMDIIDDPNKMSAVQRYLDMGVGIEEADTEGVDTSLLVAPSPFASPAQELKDYGTEGTLLYETQSQAEYDPFR